MLQKRYVPTLPTCGSLSSRWQPSLFRFPHCHGAHIERTSLFFHLLESGSAILTFLTSRMCRSWHAGTYDIRLWGSCSFYLDLMEHSLWGKPATEKNVSSWDYHAVSPSWPGEEAACRETAVAAIPGQAPDKWSEGVIPDIQALRDATPRIPDRWPQWRPQISWSRSALLCSDSWLSEL